MKPVVADIKPLKVTLEKGKKYLFCRCGTSKNNAFCDGSHAGTDLKPLVFVAEKEGAAHLCQCKYSSNLPYCDGTHRQFSERDIGLEGQITRKGKDSAPIGSATKEEPNLAFIRQLANEGLSVMGDHGPMTSMGVPRYKLPHWDDLQIMTAQLATKPLEDAAMVRSEIVIGPKAKKPLILKTPMFVSDMSFGSLSYEAKISLAKGAELVGTGICSGEGGMLPEEQRENSRYFYEFASGEFGYDEEKLKNVQAFHFKGGQAAKTGTGGHLPGEKNIAKVAEVRGLTEGELAISPASFQNLTTVEDFKAFADRVRDVTGGIPIGFKISANHIEEDIRFAIDASADYIILDGRGGGTGASPEMFRDHISVPTIPALARARKYLDEQGKSGEITLIITGGLRVPVDFVKALALGADGIAIANSAIQAIGCIGARICNTNNCPSGIATQKPELRKHIDIEESAEKLRNFLSASTELMKVMARACGHKSLQEFNKNDLSTWSKETAMLSGVKYAGVDKLL